MKKLHLIGKYFHKSKQNLIQEPFPFGRFLSLKGYYFSCLVATRKNTSAVYKRIFSQKLSQAVFRFAWCLGK